MTHPAKRSLPTIYCPEALPQHNLPITLSQLGGPRPEQDGRPSMDDGSGGHQPPLLAPHAQQQPASVADGGPGSPSLQAQQYGRQRTVLPPSVIYKMSCEYFSWPLLEPQVHTLWP